MKPHHNHGPGNAREVALHHLIEVEQGGYANLVQGPATAAATLGAADRGLANELLQGVTRRRGTLDWMLGRLLKQPLAELTLPMRNILRLGAYQLLYLTRVPPSAAVDESVKLAHKYGHPGVARLANAVLRNLIRRRGELVPPEFSVSPQEALEARYSLPAWLAARWLAAYGAQAEALAAWSIALPHLVLRTNTLKTTRAALAQALAEANIAAEPSPFVPESLRLASSLDVTTLPGYQEGWWYVQDEAAMLVSRCVDPKPGETVIDVGAAPGGKTTHMAQLMDNQGMIHAIDHRESRLTRLVENCQRLGITCVAPRVGDGRDAADWPEANRILLDVPCSGLGVLPRKPDLRWRQSPTSIAGLATLQRELLAAAADRVRPGGRLVYSTCTIGREENQDVVNDFLAKHADYHVGDLRTTLPEVWHADLTEGPGMIQLLPHRHGVDGFFLAVLERSLPGPGTCS